MYLLQLYPLKNENFAMIDDDDRYKVDEYKWYITKRKTLSYVCTDVICDGKAKRVYLHRFLMNVHQSYVKTEMVDHIDGNGLNNQKLNLRIVNSTQNHNNMKLRDDNKSGVNGVYKIDKYQFSYRDEHNKRKTKAFKTLEEAETAKIILKSNEKINHIESYCFQYFEEKRMKTKVFKTLEELMPFREQIYNEIGNLNGIRK